VIAEEAGRIGVESLVIYVVDYDQQHLVPVPSPDAAGSALLAIQGTVAGSAYARTMILDVDNVADAGRRLWLPLLDGTERVGVLRLTFPGSDRVPAPLVAACERLAHFIALLVVSKSAYTDFFERLRRTASMTLASELVWALVPPLVLASEDFVVSAVLEPCYDIGGDAFDYALNDGVLHLAVFDAMGHGLTAAGRASLAVSAYRHTPRNGAGPAAAYTAMDAALSDQHLTSRFVTALIAELHVATGQLRWVSAGHPAPLLLRGGRLIKALEITPAPPLGLRLASGSGPSCAAKITSMAPRRSVPSSSGSHRRRPRPPSPSVSTSEVVVNARPPRLPTTGTGLRPAASGAGTGISSFCS
jgi:hypothetical protein